MTSVKEFRVEREPTDDALGRGAFVFTDAYSVFDWGRMPDEIPDKGASLCTMGAFNFELLAEEGVPTHYEGVVPPSAGHAAEGGGSGDAAGTDQDRPSRDAVALDAVESPPREMAIRLARVPELPHEGDDYDYDAYHAAAGANYLIPLEVVFRNRVPVGSSLRRRTDPADHGLDLAAWPDEPVDLPEPVVEFSTKYEDQDRYLDRAEADRIAGAADLADLEAVARSVNGLLNDRTAAAGMVHEDGKIECLYDAGTVRVADVVGTFDENRFSHEGRQVSKEVLRQHHKRTQPEWVEAVAAAKAEADEQGVADWRALCDREPEPLDEAVIGVARDLYAAGTNAYTGREWFDAPPLSAAVAAARDL